MVHIHAHTNTELHTPAVDFATHYIQHNTINRCLAHVDRVVTKMLLLLLSSYWIKPFSTERHQYTKCPSWFFTNSGVRLRQRKNENNGELIKVGKCNANLPGTRAQQTRQPRNKNYTKNIASKTKRNPRCVGLRDLPKCQLEVAYEVLLGSLYWATGIMGSTSSTTYSTNWHLTLLRNVNLALRLNIL